MRLPLLLALALVAPLVAAHVAHDRPSIQPRQEERAVYPELEGANATFKLLRDSDPVSDVVTHVLDPRRGVFSVEHRSSLPSDDSAFFARWELSRLLEYVDTNGNAEFDPGADAVTRSWRLAGYAWDASGPTRVRIGGVEAHDVGWLGNATSGPRLRIEAVAAGAPFADEGATAKAQDVLVYFDVGAVPPRGVGHLHALEGVVRASPGASARLDSGPNGTTGILVEAPGRLAFLDWGAEGIVDGVEQPFATSMDGESPDGSRAFRIHFPLMDRGARLVIVSGVEYAYPVKRTDAVAWAAVVAVGVGALLLRRPGG